MMMMMKVWRRSRAFSPTVKTRDLLTEHLTPWSHRDLRLALREVGVSSRALQTAGSQLLESSVTRRLQEKLRAARTLRDRDTRTRFDREVDPDGSERPDDPLALSSRVKFREASRRKEDAPLVRDGDLFVIEQSTQDFLETKRAEYLRYGQRVEQESKVLFTPSFTSVAAHIKLPDNMKPRYVEDEGLYVGRDRLVKSGSETTAGLWLCLTPSRSPPPDPPLPHGGGPGPCSAHCPLKSKYATLYLSGAADPEGDYQLDVDVSGLIFSHHPLFSREHVLGSRLAQLYDQSTEERV
ncbi:hypothetical protein F7725_027106 [Dissostichus mawsoni]|uniref:DUF5523 domain-containing protein n=1 Tax=Dissostichus mawsoni TaxID=36200 RepID=A0A7J5XE22_DISMA|nr:hypothetical protein F7725_027106 [Dissostichus mawsoni]